MKGGSGISNQESFDLDTRVGVASPDRPEGEWVP